MFLSPIPPENAYSFETVCFCCRFFPPANAYSFETVCFCRRFPPENAYSFETVCFCHRFPLENAYRLYHHSPFRYNIKTTCEILMFILTFPYVNDFAQLPDFQIDFEDFQISSLFSIVARGTISDINCWQASDFSMHFKGKILQKCILVLTSMFLSLIFSQKYILVRISMFLPPISPRKCILVRVGICLSLIPPEINGESCPPGY